jgi:superfamily I DNA/RNA helicase/RecB family exonuclease
VDEFQDANFAQIELLQLLAGESANVFAVGDPDQAIYQFRGATAGAFEQFLARFPGATGVTLEENQRSTSGILRCAFSVISRNPKITRPGGAIAAEFERHLLRSAREERAQAAGKRLLPEAVHVIYSPPQEQPSGPDIPASKVQAAEVAASINELHEREGVPWSDFAVLYRINTHRNELTEELAARDIPFAVRGLDVLDVPEVRDVLAVLRALVNGGDSISLLRVAALPQFRIEPCALRRSLRAARDSSMADVLKSVPGGSEVVAELDLARATLAAKKGKLLEVLPALVKQFRLRKSSPAVEALRDFAKVWSKKPLTREGTVTEFIDYLDLFIEAGGKVPLKTPADNDTVQLMTAHLAKGLEFSRVFILRANTPSFPLTYKETLFEFPPELRDVRGLGAGDPKQLQPEEERRLFYVAMTRARDGLSMCAKPTGKGNAPGVFVRELVGDKSIKDVLTTREARPYRLTLAAGAAAVAASSAATWMALEPRPELLQEPLSASAIETYKTCPLKFKIQRDWRLPEEPAAAMQFGSVMHGVLRNYYEAQRAGRPQSDEQVIAVFRTLLEQAKIADPDQRRLYEAQGIRELREFLELRRAEPPVDVLATEKSFQVEIGGAKVVGRMDRIDRLSDTMVAIVDYKSGKPKDQETADESLQLSIYALAAEKALKLVPERLVLYNLENNEAVLTTRSAAELLSAEQEVRKVAEGIARAEFAPHPNAQVCRRCSYRELCPATEERLFDLQELARPAGVN